MPNTLLKILATALSESSLNVTGFVALGFTNLIAFIESVDGFTHLIATFLVTLVYGFGIHQQAKTNRYKAETDRDETIMKHAEVMKKLENRKNDDTETE